MIDNFEKIKPLLVFGENTYYYLQIIQRRKDPGNENIRTPEQQKWSKFIVSTKDLDSFKEDIIGICKLFNARAYIELNPRCLEKFSILSARRLLDRIYLKNYNRIGSLRNKVALDEDTIRTRGLIPGRRWIVDVDNKDWYEEIKDWLLKEKVNIVETLPTLNGYHIIVEAFNYKSLNIKLEKDIIIKDDIVTCIKPFSNTLLYYETRLYL